MMTSSPGRGATKPRETPRAVLLLALTCALFSTRARGEDGSARSFSIESGSLTYKLVHKLHEVEGKTGTIEGRALVSEDGSVRVQVRAKVASFDSGNANRDAHMREVTHEAIHAYASVQGRFSGLHLPLAAPVELAMSATVELNGEKQPATIPVTFRQEGAGLRATFSFPISLDKFKVERPELLFVKVDDRVELSGDLFFVAAR